MTTGIQNMDADRPRSAWSEVAPPPTKRRLVVITAEGALAHEHAALEAMFSAGLERCHVRKPGWSAARLEAWLRALPARWRPTLVLHSHHELVGTMGLGGRHWQDESAGLDQRDSGPVSDVARSLSLRPLVDRVDARAEAEGKDGPACPQAGRGSGSLCLQPRSIASRSCHDVSTLRISLGCFDAVFFSPVFPSISKLGCRPRAEYCEEDLAVLLAARTAAERRTEVIALGGITAERVARCGGLGFDGVAVLGAVWQAADPVAAFCAIQQTAGRDGPPGRPEVVNGSAVPAVPRPLETAALSP